MKMQTRRDWDETTVSSYKKLNDEVPVGFSVGVIELDQGVDSLLLLKKNQISMR